MLAPGFALRPALRHRQAPPLLVETMRSLRYFFARASRYAFRSALVLLIEERSPAILR